MTETERTRDLEEIFPPRNYQIELMKIALEKNTIIFLPTGSGKTYIALMVLKRMSGPLTRAYSEGGKISIVLVNSIALAHQHTKYISEHTTFAVKSYTGDMNCDFWTGNAWLVEFNKYNVLVMTTQILVNLLNTNMIDLNKVNLLIFDECHRGVNDHSMRQVMMQFCNLNDPPRVMGLTATILNGNCKRDSVMQAVRDLEKTFRAQVATVDELRTVVGYSTNPIERLVGYQTRKTSMLEMEVFESCQKLRRVLDLIQLQSTHVPALLNLTPLNPQEGLKKLINLVKSLELHIEMMGIYGGVKACLSHMIQIERLKMHCDDTGFLHVLNSVLTVFGVIKAKFSKAMEKSHELEKIMKFSSDKILQLISIIRDFRKISEEQMCALIFVERRFTAKIVHLILKSLSECDPDYGFIRSDFMVGYNNNPYNCTRETLFQTKKNKKVLESFINKELNVLVASNLLEEGVDIPKCTLVIKFDKPLDYRAYVQSKGRARHAKSLYYILVDTNEHSSFMEKYKNFRENEHILNSYLVGKNDLRTEPTEEEIRKVFEKNVSLEPYFVNGPNSAQINMLSAISVLCQYCNSLPSDRYTVYAPDWYMKTSSSTTDHVIVVIIMPLICPILDPIEGEPMPSKLLAKRAAAFKACVLLHKCGELTDNLLPRKHNILEELSVNFLFSHWPSDEEITADLKKRRLHKRMIAKCTIGQILPGSCVYLHIIKLDPKFERITHDFNIFTMYDMYASNTCFGIVSSNPFPPICDFPLYVSLGEISVSLKVNQSQLVLTEQQIADIRYFHVMVFSQVLEIVKPFLMLSNKADSECLFIVPVDRENSTIDFNILETEKVIKDKQEALTIQERSNLIVDEDEYLHKIVSPWYRTEQTVCIVTHIKSELTPESPFPNEAFSSFKEYYKTRYSQFIYSVNQPLLLVKGLSKKVNLLRPRGREGKRKKERLYEEMEELLIPELLTKQTFPADLWVQGLLLPTIMYRITFLLQLEELRKTINSSMGLNSNDNPSWEPLKLDLNLLNYEPEVAKKKPNSEIFMITNQEPQSIQLESQSLVVYNRDYAAKMLESGYPWKDIEEPKDLERDVNVTLLDIEYYETFIGKSVRPEDRNLLSNSPSKCKTLPALTYHKSFCEKSINILNKNLNLEGPQLSEFYKAMTAAKAHDIVNLERSETLGDSFLKFIISLYIVLSYPTFSEGKCTSFKGKLVSNKNLYYLAEKKNIGGILRYHQFKKDEWLPPSFCAPERLEERIIRQEVTVNSLFHCNLTFNEQVSGNLEKKSLDDINSEDCLPEDEENSYHTLGQFLQRQFIGDKCVSDSVESLLGVYCENSGILGGIKFVEWIGLIPQSEDLASLLNSPSPDPIINKNMGSEAVDFHIPHWREIQDRLGYVFKNHAFLLQALTHPSYSPNRSTYSYERLEFLGDAILDFLITCFIYESCGNLDPGELTDLRSALVNNNTFASYVIRLGLHKFLLTGYDQTLLNSIDKFSNYLEMRGYEIDDGIVVLLEDEDCNIAEHVDVPKVLGDVLEALAAAVYLDSGKDLNVVWKVFYKIMWREIDLFSNNVPKNVIRRLYEYPNAYPEFSSSQTVRSKTMVALTFMCNGEKKVVHGFGDNKFFAKRAAAKIALRSLEK